MLVGSLKIFIQFKLYLVILPQSMTLFPLPTDLFGWLNVVPNSNLLGMRFFEYCICIIMWHSHLNDMEIPETKRFIPEGFELGTTLS